MGSRALLLACVAAASVACGLAMSGAVSSEALDDAGLDGASDGPGIRGSDGSVEDGPMDPTDDGSLEPNLPPSTPGIVACGAGTCALPTLFCCVGRARCDGNPSACGTYKEVHCDEPADCPGEKCCLGRNSSEDSNASFRCASDCSSDSIKGVRVCRTSADCNPSVRCIARSCLGVTIGTCGGNLPPQCTDGGQ
jgi:hypothetical protein